MLKCPLINKKCIKTECALWDKEGQDCCYQTINRSLLIVSDTSDYIMREGIRVEDRY